MPPFRHTVHDRNCECQVKPFAVVDGISETAPECLAWDRKLHAAIKDGGLWGVPFAFIIMQRTPSGFTLSSLMPYSPEMAAEAKRGADVPRSAEELRALQVKGFKKCQRSFNAAGLDFSDPLNLLGLPDFTLKGDFALQRWETDGGRCLK